MTYKQLLEHLENMTDAQLEMPICVINPECGFHYPSSILTCNVDYAEKAEDVVVWTTGQTVLV